MDNNKAIDEIRENLFSSIAILTDADELLSKNETTKKYLDDYNSLEQKLQKHLNDEQINKEFEIRVQYEQAIGIIAFLKGFKLSYDLIKALDDKEFVEKTLLKLY